MSHAATHWAIQQRGLAPATKLVLWFLADRHNPDFGCFPSQEQLAHDCEMSRASVNRHLDELEARGLIRRERRVDPQTRRQRPTRYRLAFEAGFAVEPAAGPAPEPCPEMRHGSGTADERAAVPCLDLRHGPDPVRVSSHGGSVSHSSATLTGKETGKEEEEEDASARDAEIVDAEPVVGLPEIRTPAGLLRAVIEAVGLDPGGWIPGWWRGPEAEAHVTGWLKRGLSAADVVDLARRSREDNPEPPDGPKALDRVMERAARSRAADARRTSRRTPSKPADPPASPQQKLDLLAFLAERMAAGQYVPPSALTPVQAREMVHRGLATREALVARGIAL
jgi:DNA-binding transcriptional ArsR family regulator